MTQRTFLVWSADTDESEASSVEYDTAWETDDTEMMRRYDFERAAEKFAASRHSDWDYPDTFELFIMREDTRELHFVSVSAEPDVSFQEATSTDDAKWRPLLYALMAPSRWADEKLPHDWKQRRWERENPEEHTRQVAERERQRLDAIDGRCPWPTEQPPETWAGCQWPDWVPQDLRDQVEEFWSGPWRAPKEYELGMARTGSPVPRFGELVTLDAMNQKLVTGRYVHAWNNMGRVIDEHGAVHVVSTGLYGQTAEQRDALQERWRCERLRCRITDLLQTAGEAQLAAAVAELEGAEGARLKGG